MDLNTLKLLVNEKKLTAAELKKREEIAQAIGRENPNMPMPKKLAIATAQAEKSVSEAKLYMPLKGHPYHHKPDDELKYIQKDAYEAAQAMRGVDPVAENKYADQLNDASTVLHYRSKGGAIVPKKSMFEELESLDEIAAYNLVVTFIRDVMKMDPYKLKGEVGRERREKIKDSPAFKAWVRTHYESLEIEGTTLEERLGANLSSNELHKYLTSLGWAKKSSNTNHNNYSHPEASHIISVPRHGKHMNRLMTIKILKDAERFNLKPKEAVKEDILSKKSLYILELAKEKSKEKSKTPSEPIIFFGADNKGKKHDRDCDINDSSPHA